MLSVVIVTTDALAPSLSIEFVGISLLFVAFFFFSYLELVSFEMFFPFVPASARLTCVFGTLLFNRPLIQLLYSFPRGCCSFDRSSFHPCSVLIRILICRRNRITMTLGISLVFNKGIDKMWGMLHRFVGARHWGCTGESARPSRVRPLYRSKSPKCQWIPTAQWTYCYLNMRQTNNYTGLFATLRL